MQTKKNLWTDISEKMHEHIVENKITYIDNIVLPMFKTI